MSCGRARTHDHRISSQAPYPSAPYKYTIMGVFIMLKFTYSNNLLRAYHIISSFHLFFSEVYYILFVSKLLDVTFAFY